MKITYRGVQLDVIHTPNPPSRDAIYSPDGTTYLYHHWKVRAICWLNPQNVSFVTGSPPSASAGEKPVSTDVALRHWMMQPHGSLEITDDEGTELLTSPKADYVVDANNGPVPKSFNILQIAGDKSWMVEFAIETFVNENENGPEGAGGPVLLSHRWRIVHDVDQDDYSTITHEGEAVFNVAELQKLGKFPDQYRGALFPAVPKYFRREPAQIVVSEDGAKLSYRVTDREVALNQNLTNTSNQSGSTIAKRIEAYQTAGWSRGASGWAGASLAPIYNFGSSFGANNIQNLASGNAPGIGANLLGGVSQVGQQMTQNMTPQFFNTIVCRAWGNRSHTRSGLLLTCMRICVAKIMPTGVAVGYALAGLTVRATTDLVGKFVELQMTKQSGPEQAALVNAQSQVGMQWLLDWAAGTPNITPENPLDYIRSVMIADGEEIAAPDTTSIKVVSTSGDVTNPPFPNSSGSRGTWVGKLFANALSAMDASKPGDPQTGTDLNGTTTDATP